MHWQNTLASRYFSKVKNLARQTFRLQLTCIKKKSKALTIDYLFHCKSFRLTVALHYNQK